MDEFFSTEPPSSESSEGSEGNRHQETPSSVNIRWEEVGDHRCAAVIRQYPLDVSVCVGGGGREVELVDDARNEVGDRRASKACVGGEGLQRVERGKGNHRFGVADRHGDRGDDGGSEGEGRGGAPGVD